VRGRSSRDRRHNEPDPTVGKAIYTTATIETVRARRADNPVARVGGRVVCIHTILTSSVIPRYTNGIYSYIPGLSSKVEVTTLSGESIRLVGGRKRKCVLGAHVCMIRCVIIIIMCTTVSTRACAYAQVSVCSCVRRKHGSPRPSKTSPVDGREPECRFSVVRRRSSVVLGFTDMIIISIDCLIILSPVERRRPKNYGQPKAKTI